MTEHSTWRLNLAREIVPLYQEQANIEAVLVHGSVGRGWADAHSDIELFCIWSQISESKELRASAELLGATDWEWGGFDEASGGYNEQFFYKSMQVERGHWTRESVDSITADVVERYDTTQHWLMFNKQATVSALQHGVVLYGDATIGELRARITPYPEHLRVAMVQKHVGFGSFGSREMLASRDEIPLLYENNCHSVRKLLCLLFGLNRIYYPGFKWTRFHVEEMSFKPYNFYPRLQRVFQSDTVSGTRELRSLIEETFDLVEKHLPQLDILEERERFNQPYATWKLPTSENW